MCVILCIRGPSLRDLMPDNMRWNWCNCKMKISPAISINKKCHSHQWFRAPKCECCCLVSKLCLTLCNLMECSLPGSSVHWISQARILDLAAISFSRGSSWLKGWTYVFCGSCTGRWILYHWATWEALLIDWSWSNVVGKQWYHVPYLPFILLYDVSVERCAVLESIMLVFKLTLICHVMLKVIKAWV